MESRATILGHPAHPIAVMFPIGMVGFAGVCDAAYAVTNKPVWPIAARAALGAGLVGAVLAAPFGLVDYLAIPKGTRAKSIGLRHAVGNVGVLALLLASWTMRRRDPEATLGRVLAAGGLALMGVTAWLGGELVNRLGVGVYTPTSLDAPSSLGARRHARPDGHARAT